MDSKEAIIQAATELIEKKGVAPDDITVREICSRAGVGLGLVNYHFGNKDRLIEVCVERMINRVIERFREIREKTEEYGAFEKLDRLGCMTLDFLFEHAAISEISILTDMRRPRMDDNTHRTYQAYLPLVAACRPDWDEEKIKRKTFCLIAVMQQVFLRRGEAEIAGADLSEKEARHAIHTRLLRDILEVK